VADSGLDRRAELAGRLPHSAEHHTLGRKPRRQGTPELARRHDVGASAEIPEHPEDSEIAVGLYGVTDAVRHRRQRRVEHGVARADRLGVVHVDRRANGIRDGGERHAGHHERAVPPLEPGVGEERLDVGGRRPGQ
jgi:hypothetical protein